MSNRLADVARKVGVSEATVSRVLNEKPGVSEQTRQAVLTALDVLGYERPTKLRGERSRLVGLVLPELQNPIFPAFAEVVSGALAQQGFTPVLCTQTVGGVSEADYVDLLLQQQVSGRRLRRRPVRPGRRAARPLPPPRRARTADRARQRGHRWPRVPARVVRRPGRRRAGDGPPDLARPHADRAARSGPRDHMPSRRKLERARALAARGRPRARAGPHRPLAVLARGGPGRRDAAPGRGHHRASSAPATRWPSGRSGRRDGPGCGCPTTCRSSASTTPR